MQNTEGSIKPFITGKLPKEKYSDVNEFVADIASVLAINEEFIKVNLVALSDLKGDTGPRGKTGSKGDGGPTGPAGPIGPAGPGLVWKGEWVTATNYDQNDILTNATNIVYIAKAAHVSGASTEPESGGDWDDVWDELIDLQFTFGSYVVDGAIIPTGYVPFTIGGVTYKLLAKTP